MSDTYKPAVLSAPESGSAVQITNLSEVCRKEGWKIVNGSSGKSGFVFGDYLDFVCSGASPTGTLVHSNPETGVKQSMAFIHRPEDAVVAFDQAGNEFYFFLYSAAGTTKIKFEFYLAARKGTVFQGHQDDQGNGDPGAYPR